MNDKVYKIIGYYIKYLIILIIINAYITFDLLNQFPPVYIPIAYLIVKFLFIYSISKSKIKKSEIILPIVIGFTIINIVFCIFSYISMFYIISIIAFLLFLNDKKSREEEIINKNLAEFYNKQKKN